MTGRFVFWAQALDNTSPDHIAWYKEEELSPSDLRRENAVSLVSAVIKEGSRVFDKQGVKLTEYHGFFVAELPSAERDHAGRIAPIICYGPVDSSFDSTSVANDFSAFAKRIGRAIRLEHTELIAASFKELKKNVTRKLLRIVGIGALIIGLLALASWLISSTR